MSTDIVGPTNAPNTVTSRPADTRVSFGASDSWFKDCTSAISNDGTRVMAGWLNAVIGQFRSAIRGNGATGTGAAVVTEDNSDGMLLRAMQHLIQRGQTKFAVDSSSTANTVIASLSPAPPEYKAGMVYEVLMAHDCTGPSVANFNALGNKAIVRSPSSQPLAGGEWKAGDLVTLRYDGTNFQGPSAAAAIWSTGGGFNDVATFTASYGSVAIPDAVHTAVNFTSASLGTSGDVSFTSGACKILKAGRYLIVVSGSVQTAGASPYGIAAASVFRNGSLTYLGTGVQTNGASFFQNFVCGAGFMVDLALNDVLLTDAYQVSGAALNLQVGNNLTITRIH